MSCIFVNVLEYAVRTLVYLKLLCLKCWQCGHQPAIVVWDACDGSCVAELKAHKYGISCVRFSPNGKIMAIWSM